MPQWLIGFGEWLQNSPMGLWVGATEWGYPYVQMLHFTGLSLWVGTIVALDLRLLGLIGRDKAPRDVVSLLNPITWTGFFIAITGGLLLFSGIAASYVQNPAFQVKILLVITGVCLHLFMVHKARRWENISDPPASFKLVAAFEICLWIGVAFAATEIPAY